MALTRSKTCVLRSNSSSATVLFEYTPRSGGNGDTNEDQGASKITFSKHDFKQLQPAKFLNDNIIYFFLQYHLDHEVSPEVKQRIHVFDSYFFAKLKSIYDSTTDEDDSQAYQFISRWLKRVTIFDKDYLIIPVCEKDHWLLVIVCYAGNWPKYDLHNIPNEELVEPAVIVMNSCKGLAPSIKRVVAKFLNVQWRHEHGSERNFVINNSTSKNGIRLLFPLLPQQKNNYDCGVYILGYFYSFLSNPRKIYVKCVRGLNLRNLFVDNQLDISRERRKMQTVVRKHHAEWKEKNDKDDQGLNNSDISMHEEIDIISPTMNPIPSTSSSAYHKHDMPKMKSMYHEQQQKQYQQVDAAACTSSSPPDSSSAASSSSTTSQLYSSSDEILNVTVVSRPENSTPPTRVSDESVIITETRLRPRITTRRNNARPTASTRSRRTNPKADSDVQIID